LPGCTVEGTGGLKVTAVAGPPLEEELLELEDPPELLEEELEEEELEEEDEEDDELPEDEAPLLPPAPPPLPPLSLLWPQPASSAPAPSAVMHRPAFNPDFNNFQFTPSPRFICRLLKSSAAASKV